ncbi:MAG: hypothetical protein P1V21_14475 [Rhizobiaceae bacterium]|nr:hypothetical protein [Rhizobiaceae bacterium]
MLASVYPQYRRIKKAPNRRDYCDLAIEPVGNNALVNLDLISQTRGRQEAHEKMRVNVARQKKAKAARESLVE